MNVLLRFLLSVIAFQCSITVLHAQNTTNKGTEFWTGYMDHIDGAGLDGTKGTSQMSLYITSDVSTSGKVEIADGSSTQDFTVLPNQVTIINIPPSAFLDYAGTYNKGIHITSQKPIAVYAHIYASSVSGATLLLPVSTLGKDYQSINYTQLSNSLNSLNERKPSYSTFMVIATEDNTSVEITPSVPLLSGHAAGVPFTITLPKGHIYQDLSSSDLTGTHIKSISANGVACKRIAVFSGSTKISIGCPTQGSSDNLFQQVYPTSTWGKNYITVPFSGRAYDIFRIVVSDPTASVMMNGSPITVPLKNGNYYEFNATEPNVISSDKPIQVVQYAVTQGTTQDCKGKPESVGDPEMIYLTPIEQGLDHVTLYSANQYRITNSYVNIVLPTNAVSSFMLDGVVDQGVVFKPIPANPAYSYAQIPVMSGQSHTIKASGTFNAIAYGFGNTESYGYAAGTDLKNLNEFVSVQEATNANNVIAQNGCSDINYSVRLTLAYPTSSITWDFKDGTVPVVQNNPTPTQVQNGNQTLYVYEYTKTLKFTKGDHSVIATVFNPSADDCGQYDNVEFDFTIVDPPVPKFSYTNSCLGTAMQFKDVSDPDVSAIKTWNWDFGDGETGTGQNPTHTYQTTGDYNVTMTVINDAGCSSTSAPQKIHISTRPVANFKFSVLDCAGQDIAFTDQSVLESGSVGTWSWDFGDGSTAAIANPKHTYATAGTYTVSLVVTNANGCASELSKHDIIVNPLPAIDFVVPDVCLADAFAQFKDNTTIADGTESQFIYHWDFGDGGTSADKNPKHKYTTAQLYIVTLTVTSKYGCIAVKSKSFTVNGANPKAAFSVENANNLCSSDAVIFDDLSDVDFGGITKIEWDFGDGSGVKTFSRSAGEIPADKKFNHSYGLFNSVNSKTYTVTMTVYSGGVCSDSKSVPIVIHGNPKVDIVPVPPVCEDADAFQIYTNTNGFTGTSTFSGKGVGAAGLFNPKVAGVGLVDINYLFTDTYGCTYSQVVTLTVNPVPVVSAAKDIELLQGNSVTLDMAASGNNLTYQWVPAIGLDHDNILNPVATPMENTRYTLTVKSADGCTSSSFVNVYVLKLPEIPNTFTPNGDGINDLWYIKHLEDYPDCTVEVFTRSGEKVYASRGYHIPWDGRYKGTDLPAGVYYYIINPKAGRKAMSGSITIIK